MKSNNKGKIKSSIGTLNIFQKLIFKICNESSSKTHSKTRFNNHLDYTMWFHGQHQFLVRVFITKSSVSESTVSDKLRDWLIDQKRSEIFSKYLYRAKKQVFGDLKSCWNHKLRILEFSEILSQKPSVHTLHISQKTGVCP